MADKKHLVEALKSKDYYEGVVRGLELAKDKFRKDNTHGYIGLIEWLIGVHKEWETKAGHTPRFTLKGPLSEIPVKRIDAQAFMFPGAVEAMIAAVEKWRAEFNQCPKFATGTDYVQPVDAVKSPDGYKGPEPTFDTAKPEVKMIEGLKGAWSFHIQDSTTLSDTGIQAAIREMGLKLKEVIDAVNSLNKSPDGYKAPEEGMARHGSETKNGAVLDDYHVHHTGESDKCADVDVNAAPIKTVNTHNVPVITDEFIKLISGDFNSVKIPNSWNYQKGDQVIVVEFVVSALGVVTYTGDHLHRKIQDIIPGKGSDIYLILSEIE